MIVYVDVLITIKFIVDNLLLLVSGRLCGVRLNRLRIAIAALAGGISSLILFLPPLTPWINITLTLLISAALTAVAGGYHSIRSYAVRLFWLLTVSFLFAGLMLFLILISGGRVGFYQNGICYFRISALQMLAGSTAAYIVILFVQKIGKRGLVSAQEYRVQITVEGKTGERYGVMDSQNRLIDLFTGTPVVIASPGLLGDLLPATVEHALHAPMEGSPGVRMIVCTTVAGQELLPAFRPERMLLSSSGRNLLVEDVFIAVTAQPIDALILNPALTGRDLPLQKLQEGGAL